MAVYVTTNCIVYVYFIGSAAFTSSELSVFIRLYCLMLSQDTRGSVDGRWLVLDKLSVVLCWCVCVNVCVCFIEVTVVNIEGTMLISFQS